MRLGQEEAALTVQQDLNAERLQSEIRELNLRMAASEDYKKWGLVLAGIMILVRIIK